MSRFTWPPTLPMPQITGYAVDDNFDVAKTKNEIAEDFATNGSLRTILGA